MRTAAGARKRRRRCVHGAAADPSPRAFLSLWAVFGPGNFTERSFLPTAEDLIPPPTGTAAPATARRLLARAPPSAPAPPSLERCPGLRHRSPLARCPCRALQARGSPMPALLDPHNRRPTRRRLLRGMPLRPRSDAIPWPSALAQRDAAAASPAACPRRPPDYWPPPSYEHCKTPPTLIASLHSLNPVATPNSVNVVQYFNQQLVRAGAHAVMAGRRPKVAQELIQKWQNESSETGTPLNAKANSGANSNGSQVHSPSPKNAGCVLLSILDLEQDFSLFYVASCPDLAAFFG
ncbi:hypothetical protein U9M48_000375 [Paspalum notatum var. saurae]|uniref:Uncharacterized protein n=1 Tax=Paspalum notatum var. saurae TaxID=547442 RepID=A0AAQ3SHE2_PASNO